MPTIRTRNVSDTHPVARWLFQAIDAGAAQSLRLTFSSPADATRVARQLRRFRSNGCLASPGTYDPTPIDPKGEGRGMFDAVQIRLGKSEPYVELRYRPKLDTAEPLRVEIL